MSEFHIWVAAYVSSHIGVPYCESPISPAYSFAQRDRGMYRFGIVGRVRRKRLRFWLVWRCRWYVRLELSCRLHPFLEHTVGNRDEIWDCAGSSGSSRSSVYQHRAPCTVPSNKPTCENRRCLEVMHRLIPTNSSACSGHTVDIDKDLPGGQGAGRLTGFGGTQRSACAQGSHSIAPPPSMLSVAGRLRRASLG
jgi:hypothetical protein